jgi:A118 family predicted phage portal protein
LEDHADTAGYAALVDAEGAIGTGVKGLTAAYVPNARPMPAWRAKPGLCELGKPDLAGVEPLMADIDEAWSSLIRDVRLSKARLVVPEYMLQNLGAGQGVAFDADQEIFTPLSMPPADTNVKQITPQQFDIRVDQHLGVVNAALREVLRLTGYSPLTFGLPDEVAATATEIHSREKDSLQTRGSKIRHWSAALGPLVTTLLQLDALVFRSGAAVSEDVDLDWPDGAREPLEVRARSVAQMAQAQAASIESRVRIMQPDLDAAAVKAEADLIRAEQGMSVDNPDAVA